MFSKSISLAKSKFNNARPTSFKKAMPVANPALTIKNSFSMPQARRYAAADDTEFKLDPSFVENQINSMLEKEENPHMNVWRKIGRPTQEKIISFIRDHIGGSPKQYKSKYPSVGLSEVRQQINDQISRPIYGLDDPQFVKWVGSLGYSKTEMNSIIHARFPDFDAADPKWDELTAVFSDSNTDMKSWKLISEAIGGMKAAQENSAAAAATDEAAALGSSDIDWATWEIKLGKDSADQMKKSLDETLAAIPSFQNFDVTDIVKTYFDPLVRTSSGGGEGEILFFPPLPSPPLPSFFFQTKPIDMTKKS